MAGYRPKSLDELNNIFDKTIAAEKAIKKGTSLLEKGEDSFSSFSAQVTDKIFQDIPSDEKQSEAIADSVSDFIAKFSVQTKAEPVKAKPQMTVITPEPIKKEYEIISDDSAAETPSAPTETEKSSRDELFDEYMKIMSDEDDDSPSEKKLSRKEKKKLRKKEKAARKNAAQPISEEKPAEAEAPLAEEASEEPAFEAPVQTIEEIAEEAQPTPGEPVTEALPEEDIFSEEEPVYEEVPVFEEERLTEEEPTFEEEPVFEAPAYEKFEEEPVQELSDEEQNDFVFPENYTPEWIKENEILHGLENEEPKEKLALDFKKIFLKLSLVLVLIALISTGTLATLLKTAVAPNTGKLVADKYYVFTTYKDYPEMGIAKDALIITEKKYASEGEFFVYVDYANKTFEVGRRTDSITKEDGEVLYVTERDGGRTLVSRDDCKGVVHLTYENRGSIISFLTDNYIIIVAVVLVLSLAIILVLTLVLRNRKEDEFEAFEEEYEEEEYENFDDIFSTIE